MRIAAYTLLDWDRGLYGPHKSAWTLSNLVIVGVMLLFYLTTRVDLLPMHGMYILSMTSGFSIVWWIAAVEVFADNWIGNSSLSNIASESSEPISTFAGSYSLPSCSKIIPSTNLAALTTQALLMWANRRCQRRMRLFWLIRCIGWPCPFMAIAQARPVITITLGYMVIAMAFLG